MNSISVHAERLFVRLIMKADDYGRLSGNPKLLRPLLFPLLLNQVREADLQRWIAECEKAVLIRLYESDGKQYIEITNFKQRTRAETSKYPEPPGMSDRRQTSVRHQTAYSETKAETETEAQSKARQGGSLTAKGVLIPGQLATPKFLSAWATWEEHLRKKKVKTTDTADKMQLEKCVEWGVDCAIQNIRHSVAGNYQGLYPAKNGTARDETPEERSRRISEMRKAAT